MKPTRGRPSSNADDGTLLVGRNPVREALERGDARLEKVMLQKGLHGLDGLRKLAQEQGVPVQFVPQQKIEQVARGLTHQGVVAPMAAVAYADVDEMLAGIAPTYAAVQSAKPVLVLLDGISDPHNLGAILRSAVASGAAGAVVPAQGSAPLGAVALKASAGTALRLPVARVNDLAALCEALKERGYWIVGAAGEGETVYTDYDWNRAVALVIGSEGDGLSAKMRRACDELIHIPMRGPAESLNASVAAGILLFEAARVRVGAA